MQLPYAPRLFGTIAKIRTQPGSLTSVASALQTWIGVNWKDGTSAWCAVERSQEQGARRRNIRSVTSTLRDTDVPGLEMDSAKGEIMQHTTVVARARFGATTWQKLENRESNVQTPWEQIHTALWPA